MFKKVFVAVAAMVMLATGVLAYTATVNGIEWTYTVSDGKASISYMPTSITGAITIPSSLGGYPVTSIGESAFEGCSGLTSITIPDGVTTIGRSVFDGCWGLTSITIPDSVTSIGSYAFYDCSGLTSIIIPDSVTSIGHCAFSGCSGLTSITIPDSITSIEDFAFSRCSGLTSITIPDSVTSIGYMAFSGCSGLTSITIPDSVTSIGESAFNECYDLKSAIFLGDAPGNVGNGIFSNCADDFTIKVKKGTKGWDGDYTSTALPTTWHGYPIVYATESELTYKVVFNANGGSGTMSDQSMTYNNAAYLNNNAFKRTGYTFQGWAKSKTGTVAYKNGASVKNLASSGTVTLYAIWKPTTYNVAFNANGGSGSMAAQTIVFNTWTKLRANAFKRTGYTFQGWAKSKTGTVAYKDGVSVKNLASSGIVTLYAVWKPNTYKVVFNANGGKGTMAATYMKYGKTAKLKKNTFKRSGYVFIGWAKSKKGAVAYKNTASVKNLRPTGTITLYAVWAKTKYKVAFYANGGKGKMSTQTLTYDKSSKLKKNTFKRTGYTFVGWAKSKKGAVTYKNTQAIKNLTTKGSTIKLYAKWAKTKYKVAFYANGGSGSMSAQAMTYNKAAYLKKNAFKRTGYTFKGWAKSPTGSVVYANGKAVKNLTTTGGTVKLYAVWKPNTYKVTFYPNGGTGSAVTQTMTYNKAANLRSNTFTRTGYAFAGWAKSTTGSVAYTNGQSVKNLTSTNGATVKLYAVWKPNTYKVTFYPNGGTGSAVTQTMTYNKAANLRSNTFTRTGHAFAGWATSADGDVVYADGEVVKNLTSEANGVVDLYAKWETTYTVCFNANGGEGTMSNQAFTYSVEQALSLNTFTLEGYGFAGWATSADGDVVYADGEVVKNLTSEANGVVDLYAKWETTYTVCFNANGGEGTMLNQTITHSVEQSLASNEFKRDGYFFAGWATSQYGDVIYENAEKVKNLTSEANSEIHLYAVWKSFFVYEGEHKGVQLWKDGPHWAETNIGAKNPEDFGYYFWWGDTIGYKRENDKWVASDGSSSNFSFEESNVPTYDKDKATLKSEGWITSSGVLAPAHDAAQVKWGSRWRMPTDDDLLGLVVNCTHTWTTKNGVQGYEIKGKGDYSGASIFLPAAGYGDGTQLQLQGSFGRYLSSVPSLADSKSNTELNFFGNSGDFYVRNTSYRSMGCTIRPVVNQQYTVQFNANGGIGEMPDQLFTYGIEQPLSPNSFYRDGYTFAGWTTIIEERRVFLADNRVVKNLTTKTDGIVTLDAVWITHSYTQLWKDGPYWAGTNIGAEKPWDYGYYFWWGDITGYKSNGTSFSFSFDSSNTPTYDKNNETLLSNGWISSNGVLLPEHDAARVYLGEKWRMPTHMELYNLYERCPSVWVTINGVSGYLFSKSNDYSESIFLPAAGYGNENSLIGANLQGFYWSSVISRSSGDSYYLYFDSKLTPKMLDNPRHYGQPIRPVLNHTFIVRFNANGGFGTMEGQTFSYGVEQALSLNLYYNASCTFEGWATSADGEVVYTDGEVVENLTKEVDGVVELFAVWKFVDKVQLWEGGPYWATKNIGATKPEDYGLYFWWGDTVGHKPNGSSFSFDFDCDNMPTHGKTYSELKSEGWITSSGVLAPSHDAARAHWGSNWRMPTDVEFDALCDNCTWTWISVNGVNGYIVRGKGAYSGASIFLPAAGYGNGTSLNLAGSDGYYRSSIPFSDIYSYSRSLRFDSSYHFRNFGYRGCGYPVRPVSDVH